MIKHAKRNRRAGVEDRWTKTVRDDLGNTQTVPSANHGKGVRWRARYVDDRGHEHAKAFSRKVDAQQWLDKEISDHVTGTWDGPEVVGPDVRRPGRAVARHQGHSFSQDRGRDTDRCSTPSSFPAGGTFRSATSRLTPYKSGLAACR